MDAIFQVLGQRIMREIKLNNGAEPTSLVVSEDEMKRIEEVKHRFGTVDYIRIAMIDLRKTLTLRLTVVEVGMEKASGDGRFGYGFRAAPKRGRHRGETDTSSDFTPPKVDFDFDRVDSLRYAWESTFGGPMPEPPKRPSPFKVSDEDIKRAEEAAHFHPSPGPAHWGVDFGKESATTAGSGSVSAEDVKESWRRVEDIARDPFMSDDLRKMVEEAVRRAAGLK